MRNRRAVSYLVTVVLMTLIAVALSTLLYAYFSGWIGQRTTATGPVGALSIDTAAAYVNSTSITFKLYIRNSGVGDVVINEAILAMPNGTRLKAPDPSLGIQMNTPPIHPGSAGELTITVSKDILKPGSYNGWWNIKALGDDGSLVDIRILVK